MEFLNPKPDQPIILCERGGLPEQAHLFDADSVRAINAALAARRPLLVRGEPGIGKSQLARAAAKLLKRPYLQFVVDARTESRDLLWHYDAVARLAEAQLSGALKGRERGVRRRLAVRNFVHPGPLWWAFDWIDASRQAAELGEHPVPTEPDANPANGAVLLIDEIDKAESDLPNGLLEALGLGEFTPLGRKQPVAAAGVQPLVVITTNEERALPDAFLRRCLVLRLSLPKARREFRRLLFQRACAHFPESHPRVILKALAPLMELRVPRTGAPAPPPLPGQAEYLDLLRAVLALAPGDPAAQRAAVGEITRYTLHKHQDDPPDPARRAQS